MNSLYIAHITDLHILDENQLNQGVDVRANFQKVLKDVKADGTINKIVIGGDLGHDDPSEETLMWIKAQLDQTEIDYKIIPGNHDNIQKIAKVFNLESEIEEGRLFFWDELDFGKIFYLDTSNGDLPMHQLAWVEEECGKSYQKFLLFMHHPPVLGNVYLMDEYHALENMNQVQKILRNINNIQGIFCGHYHNERTIRLYNHMVMITPSTFVQIDDQSETFKISSKTIGWRKIIWDGSYLNTYVQYL
jgi:Icc protein